MARQITQQQPHFEVIVQEDPETGDLLLPLPEELMTRMGWKIGQDIEWAQDQNGNWVLRSLTPGTGTANE